MTTASFARSVASGSTDVFSVPFGYLDQSHVHVYLDGVLLSPTAYSWPSAGEIQITAGNPSAGTVVERRRSTPITPLVEFSPGNLSAADLNTGNLQPLYLAQEANDLASDILSRAWLTSDYGTGKTIDTIPEGHVWKADVDGNMVDGGSADAIGDAQGYAEVAAEKAAEASISAQAASDLLNAVLIYDPTFRYPSPSVMLASTRAAGGPGTTWQAGMYLYTEAAAGASDHHLTTAGGVKLYVQTFPDGAMPLLAFAPVADGVTDDYAKIIAALAGCFQAGSKTLDWGAANIAWGTTIDLTPYPRITLRGQVEGSWRGGTGAESPSVMTWRGGAEPMFTYGGVSDTITGFTVVNVGNGVDAATDFIAYTAGNRHRIFNNSFLPPTGAPAFTRSIVYVGGNYFSYSFFERNQVTSTAPKVIFIDTAPGGNGITPFFIRDNWFAQGSFGTGAMTVLYVKACSIEGVQMTGNNFIQQSGGVLTIVDNTDSTLTYGIGFLHVFNNEIETANGVNATDRYFKLKNIRAFKFDANVGTGGGARTAWATLVNTRWSAEGNELTGANGPFAECDATSYFSLGINTQTQTTGMVDTAAPGIIDIAWTTGTCIFYADYAPGTEHRVFRISPTSGGAWTLAYNNTGRPAVGQIITIMIRNASGGAVNNPTMPAGWKTAATVTSPANGFSRSYTFVWNGANWIELYRGAADVPN